MYIYNTYNMYTHIYIYYIYYIYIILYYIYIKLYIYARFNSDDKIPVFLALKSQL